MLYGQKKSVKTRKQITSFLHIHITLLRIHYKDTAAEKDFDTVYI